MRSHREKKKFKKGPKSVLSVSQQDSERTKSRQTRGRLRGDGEDGAALSNTATLELRQQHVAGWATTRLLAELHMLQPQGRAHTAARHEHAAHSLIQNVSNSDPQCHRYVIPTGAAGPPLLSRITFNRQPYTSHNALLRQDWTFIEGYYHDSIHGCHTEWGKFAVEI